MLDAYACLRHEPWTARIDYGRAELAIGFPQHPNQNRPERPILLAVDQATLGVSPQALSEMLKR